jgi:hypothetical protein
VHSSIHTVSVLLALTAASTVHALAQSSVPNKNQFSLDIGVLQGGLSYARRLGQKNLSLGGGVWGAWEPWSTFESNVWEPLGVELFLRAHPSRDVHLEAGPSLLRYYWADDCSECTGTFVGIRAAAMAGQGIFSLGPTARVGRLTGAPGGNETGLLFGFQARLLFSWN